MYLKFSYYMRNLLTLYLSSKLQVENLISLSFGIHTLYHIEAT